CTTPVTQNGFCSTLPLVNHRLFPPATARLFLRPGQGRRKAPRRRRLSTGMTAVFTIAAVVMTVLPGFNRGVVAQGFDLDPRIEQLVAEVSEERLAAILVKLESFGTRN